MLLDFVVFLLFSLCVPATQQDGAGLPAWHWREPVCFARAWWELLSHPSNQAGGHCTSSQQGLAAAAAPWRMKVTVSHGMGKEDLHVPPSHQDFCLDGAGCASPCDLPVVVVTSQRM